MKLAEGAGYLHLSADARVASRARDVAAMFCMDFNIILVKNN